MAASGAGVELVEGAFVAPKLNLGAEAVVGVGVEPNGDAAAGVVDVAEDPNADVGWDEANADGGFAESPFVELAKLNTDEPFEASDLPLSAENGEPMDVVVAGDAKGLQAFAPSGLDTFAGGALKLPNPLTLLIVDA